MKIRRLNFGLFILLLSAVVFAQPTERTGDQGLADDGLIEEDGALAGKRQLSAAEQVAEANNYIGRMKNTLVVIKKLGDRARNEKDIIKLNCVNDKLLQVKGNLNLAEQFLNALNLAAAKMDNSARQHEFSKIAITHQKVVILEQEAEACVGEEISYVGSTRVDVEMENDIPEEDPTVAGEPPLPEGPLETATQTK